jgi:hypothetical protein
MNDETGSSEQREHRKSINFDARRFLQKTLRRFSSLGFSLFSSPHPVSCSRGSEDDHLCMLDTEPVHLISWKCTLLKKFAFFCFVRSSRFLFNYAIWLEARKAMDGDVSRWKHQHIATSWAENLAACNEYELALFMAETFSFSCFFFFGTKQNETRAKKNWAWRGGRRSKRQCMMIMRYIAEILCFTHASFGFTFGLVYPEKWEKTYTLKQQQQKAKKHQ